VTRPIAALQTLALDVSETSDPELLFWDLVPKTDPGALPEGFGVNFLELVWSVL